MKTPYYKALTRNMILTIILVSFTPMIIVIIVLLNQFQTSYEDKMLAHLKEVVMKHKQNIDTFLKERLSDIRHIAGTCGMESLSDDVFIAQKLEMLQMHYIPMIVDIGLVNSEGYQVAYAGPFKLGKANYSEADWFKKAMQNPYVISDVFMGLRGVPHFIVSVKKNSDGKDWILRATIDFVIFNNLVENIKIGETGFAFILNQKGEFQTSPHSLPGNITIEKILADKNTDIQISKQKDESGKENIYVTSWLKNGEWVLVYQQDADDAFSIVRRARRIAFLIFLVGGAAIITMAYTLSVWMVKQIAASDREKDMMNQQVVETGKLASIGELAAGIAHEINNPVAIMVEEAGWIQDILEEDKIDLDEFKRALNQIKTQGKRCKEITHKLLSFARKTDSSIKELNLNELLEEIISLTTQRAKYSNVNIEAEFTPDLPLIRASHTEMQQIFLNLINNAIDAMEKTGGTVKITTRNLKDRVMIEISDTGPGIPKAILGRIFDPFFTTKPVGKGTGLGLSICYGIVKKMGGDISVKSVVELGTIFHVFLPIPKTVVSDMEKLEV